MIIMKKVSIVFLLLVSLSSFTVLHKFYVSVMQIEYNESQKSLQIISRVFIDDFEEVLKERYDNSVEIAVDKESEKNDDYIKKYLSQKIKLFIDGEEVSFTYLGKEYEDDLMLCYLEIENVEGFNEIEVSNQVLMDLYEEQQNIIHVKKDNLRKSLILEKGKDRGVLKFGK